LVPAAFLLPFLAIFEIELKLKRREEKEKVNKMGEENGAKKFRAEKDIISTVLTVEDHQS
jgi:hypothetical protein